MSKTNKSKEVENKTFSSEHRNLALEIAVQNFEEFCNFAGVNKQQLSICIERQKGKSYGQISQKLNVPKSTVKDTCDRCIK